ncbi:hypothetical protein LY13_004022 [Prauserella aidingensis]|uniref:hypothetical protein n=1 Tax=Prauserella aidingensis TaxID=387890 RepID=UPI0020A5BB82|nr:hypothetical protein [Prauserella aidingensis]MCP2255248.1 hypothetical protein [Prauserella aidingensis]
MSDSSGMSNGDSELPRYPSSGGANQQRQPGVIPLEPLRLGEVIGGAFTTMRSYAGIVFGTSFVIAVISAAVSYFVTQSMLADVTQIDPAASPERQMQQLENMLGDMLPAFGVQLAVMLLVQAVLTGLLMTVVGRAVLGKPITFGEAWAELKPRLLSVLGLSVVVTVAQAVVAGVFGALLITTMGVFGALLTLVPVIAIWVYLSLATAALVLERGTIGSAIKRSVALVKGAWWRVFGFLLVAVVIGIGVSLIVGLPFSLAGPAPGEALSGGDVLIQEIGNVVTSTIVTPFMSLVAALIYIDQRIRRENLAPELRRASQM